MKKAKSSASKLFNIDQVSILKVFYQETAKRQFFAAFMSELDCTTTTLERSGFLTKAGRSPQPNKE